MKVLILDKNHEHLESILMKNGFEVVTDFISPKAEIEETIEEYQGVFIRSRFPLDKAFISKAIHLKFIGRIGAGMENIDLPFAKEKNIKCFNAPEGNRDAVAEHCLGQLLMLLNKLHHIDWQVRNGIWKREPNRGHELKGKTIGILGYGNMGKSFAQRLKGFEVACICYDILDNVGDQNSKQVSLQEFFEHTDVLSIHLPHNKQTVALVNHQFLNKFQKPIYLINSARGSCLVLNDLNIALKSGKVLGACLDVLEVENSAFEDIFTDSSSLALKELLNNDKIVFSPHVAGWTYESKIKLDEIIAQKVIDAYF